jgi:hypothetical protein
MKIRDFARDFMGRQVAFDQTFHRAQVQAPDGSWLKTWEAGPTHRRVGWVVGVRWLATGFTERDDYGHTFIAQGKRIPCYLVTTWPTQEPWRVPPEAVTVLTEPEEPQLMSEAERKFMSEQSQAWARDAKGRFTEEPLTKIGVGVGGKT